MIRTGIQLGLITLVALGCSATPGAEAPSAEPTEPTVTEAGKQVLPVLLAIDRTNVSRLKKSWEVELGGRGVAVAVDRAAARVVAATVGSSARLYDLWGGRSKGVSASCAKILRGGLALHGRKLVVVCQDQLELYESRTLKQLDAPSLAESRATATHISWPWVVVGHHDGVLRVYGLEGQATREIRVPGPPVDVKSVALSGDGTRVAVAWVQGSVWWWSLDAPEQPHRLVRHERESDALAWDSRGRLLADEGATRRTTLWSFEDKPTEFSTIEQGAWVKRLWFTLDSSWLIRGGSRGLEVAEVAGPGSRVLDARGPVEDLALDTSGTSLAAVDRDGHLTLWNPKR